MSDQRRRQWTNKDPKNQQKIKNNQLFAVRLAELVKHEKELGQIFKQRLSRWQTYCGSNRERISENMSRCAVFEQTETFHVYLGVHFKSVHFKEVYILSTEENYQEHIN